MADTTTTSLEVLNATTLDGDCTVKGKLIVQGTDILSAINGINQTLNGINQTISGINQAISNINNSLNALPTSLRYTSLRLDPKNPGDWRKGDQGGVIYYDHDVDGVPNHIVGTWTGMPDVPKNWADTVGPKTVRVTVNDPNLPWPLYVHILYT